MERPEVVIVCAASGTRLSAIAQQMRDPQHPGAVRDLESELCESYRGHQSHVELGLQSDELPTMWHVVRRPREELYEAWKESFASSLRGCVGEDGASARLLVMHLSWYQPSTSEFFSPVSVSHVQEIIQSEGCNVTGVVILIDDIYDMLARLQGDDDIYRANAIDSRADRLRGLHYGADETALTKKRARLEALESALMHLVSWRQHEILQAESIARELDADFTVFGIKHSRAAFEHLTKPVAVPRTYLSHRISEVRRMNKAMNDLPTSLGEWSAVVDEVNRLHMEFAQHGQVLINPTAIDELRFAGPDDDGSFSPYLARRWNIPAPHAELLWIIPDGGYEHTDLLADGIEVPDVSASSVARALSGRIYFDVAFRDHVIVEHTAGLCVYRPFFQDEQLYESGPKSGEPRGANWSGGVKPEITHWYRKGASGSGPRRRLAFVHTRAEIRSRIAWICDDGAGDVAEVVLNHLPDLLADRGIDAGKAETLCMRIRVARASVAEGSHLEQDPVGRPVQLDEVLGEDTGDYDHLIHALETAYQLAMHDAFTMLPRPSMDEYGESIFDVVMLLGHERPEGDRLLEDLPDVAQTLCKFFRGDFSTTDLVEMHKPFWRVHGEQFDQVVGMEPIEFCCRLLKLPYDYLKEKSEYLTEG